MTILDDILQQKEKEVQQLKEKTFSDQTVKKQIPKIAKTFRKSEKLSIISEIKRVSPSKGSINPDVNPVEQAKNYERLGASAISVLTDETFFKGSMDDLRAVREAVALPLLCKDFIIDESQIDRAQAAGASIILLIVAALSKERLIQLYKYATDKGLEVLCEVHNEQEMEIAIKLDPAVIGINNRNLKTFDVDLGTTEKLASMVKNPDTVLISESGIKSQEDVLRVEKAGAAAILVGETFMRSSNLEETFASLRIPRSGLTG